MLVTATSKGQSQFTQSQFTSEGFSITVSAVDLGFKEPSSPEQAKWVAWQLGYFAREQVLAMLVGAGVITVENFRYQLDSYKKVFPAPPEF